MIFDANSAILVLFCRRPSLGVGKQRIAAELGTTRALEISELLLAAALEDASSWPDRVVIAPAVPADKDWATSLLPTAYIIPQPAGDLGKRLKFVDEEIRRNGGAKVLFMGSDAPALDAATLISALAKLEHDDAVLAPARDGGVTLLGARRPWPDLEQLPWETDQLAEALTASCKAAGMTVARLPLSYDIDVRADLEAALTDLQLDPRTSRQNICAWIRTIVPSEDRISAIIPVLADIPALDALLTRLGRMHGIDEVIVVDGEQSADCRRLCHLRDVHYLQAPACRGSQLIAGAARASGNVLWFLHADSEPAPAAPAAIRQHLDSGHIGGFFRFKFTGPQRWYKTLLMKAINLRTRFGMPYGDQGLFVRHEEYTRAGGFASTPLFEEVRLVKGLRKQGKFKGVTQSIGVSPRRWERDGWLLRSVHNRLLALAFMVGVPPEKLVRLYRASGSNK